MFDHTQTAGVGVVGIRVLAGGALSGSAERHPIAGPAPDPIGSAMSYDADVERARRLMPLVKEGFAASLTEAATRFALSHPAMGTLLVGMATPQQFEDSLAAVRKRPAAAGRARPAVGTAAGIFRRTAMKFRFPPIVGPGSTDLGSGDRECERNSRRSHSGSSSRRRLVEEHMSDEAV